MATSSNQTEYIKALAKLFFTPEEIGIILEVEDVDAFNAQCRLLNTPEGKAYESGRLQSEKEVRESIVKVAKQGSSPAQTMVLEMIKQSKLKMLTR